MIFRKILKRGNILIKLADASSSGSDDMKQYESNPAASGTEDESSIIKAKSRVLKRKIILAKVGILFVQAGVVPLVWSSKFMCKRWTFYKARHFFFVVTTANLIILISTAPSFNSGSMLCLWRQWSNQFCPRVQMSVGTVIVRSRGKPE